MRNYLFIQLERHRAKERMMKDFYLGRRFTAVTLLIDTRMESNSMVKMRLRVCKSGSSMRENKIFVTFITKKLH